MSCASSQVGAPRWDLILALLFLLHVTLDVTFSASRSLSIHLWETGP